MNGGRSIEIESGVSLFTREGFCAVRVGGELVGQLSPDATRAMALQFLAAADAAESDAVVMRMLTAHAGLDDETAGSFLLAMRDLRAGSPK